MSPDNYRDQFYPDSAVRLPNGSLAEALGYIMCLVPGLSWADHGAIYADLEGKAWESWSYATGLSRY